MSNLENKKVEGQRQKVATKAETKKPVANMADFFSNRQVIPPHIQKELDEQGLIGRFLSLKMLGDSGGYHPKGWTPYVLKNPIPNPITGNADKTYRVGDLVLGVKTKELHAAHRAHLDQRAAAQSLEGKRTIQEMRDRIRESRSEKHIGLIEGYEENGGDED